MRTRREQTGQILEHLFISIQYPVTIFITYQVKRASQVREHVPCSRRANADPCQEVAYPTKMQENRKRAAFQPKATRSQADIVMSLEGAS